MRFGHQILFRLIESLFAIAKPCCLIVYDREMPILLFTIIKQQLKLACAFRSCTIIAVTYLTLYYFIKVVFLTLMLGVGKGLILFRRIVDLPF